MPLLTRATLQIHGLRLRRLLKTWLVWALQPGFQTPLLRLCFAARFHLDGLVWIILYRACRGSDCIARKTVFLGTEKSVLPGICLSGGPLHSSFRSWRERRWQWRYRQGIGLRFTIAAPYCIIVLTSGKIKNSCGFVMGGFTEGHPSSDPSMHQRYP